MRYTVVPAVILLAFASCNISNKKDVFADLDPASKKYKQELARQIQNTDGNELTFTLNQYLKIEGKDYLDISINGKDIHAKSLILVNNWNKLEGIKQTKGVGYSGAELKNLQLSIINVDTEPTFIYKDLDKVVD
jgi:hypothetical protein